MGTADEERAATEAYTSTYEAYMQALREHLPAVHEAAARRKVVDTPQHVWNLQDAYREAETDYRRVLSTNYGVPAPPREA